MKYTIKPTLFDAFICSNLSVLILRPMSIIGMLILLYTFCFLFITTRIDVGESLLSILAIIFTVGTGTFLAIMELVLIISLLTNRKLFLQEVEVEFADKEFITSRPGVETKSVYSSITKLRRIGKYLLFQSEYSPRGGYLPAKDTKEAEELYKFINERRQ